MQASFELCEHPFVQEPAIVAVTANQTIQQMLNEALRGRKMGVSLAVSVGDVDVPQKLWSHVKPKPGTRISVVVMPMGGGKGSKILRTVLLVAVAALATAASGGLFGGAFGLIPSAVAGTWQAAALGAAISMVGSLAINALIPPPKAELGGSENSTLHMLTGSSNSFAPYGVIPYVLGEFKLFPPHAAKPFSESMGSVQYQTVMLDLGYDFGWGMEVSDIKIGDTPLGNYPDVQHEITKDPTLYVNDVEEVGVSANLPDNTTVTRFTVPDTEQISLDFVFAAGLYGTNSKGKLRQATAILNIRYRRVGDSTWLNAPAPGTETGGFVARANGFTGNQIRTNDRKPFIASRAWGVDKGSYEIEVNRGATNWNGADENSRVGDCQWSVLRSVKRGSPSNTGTWKLVIRIKSTDQLTGTLGSVNCIVKQKIPIWENGAWTEPRTNYNTAWVIYHLMTSHPSVAYHVKPTRMLFDEFVAFADYCNLHEFQTKGVCDAEMTLKEMIDDILSCSLGTLISRDGKFGIAFDNGQQPLAGSITPYESKDLNVSRVFTKLPHALRVRFKNPDANWEEDEILVCDDLHTWRGLNARGVESILPPATEFEVLELRWTCDAHTAWRVARMHLAQARFRPNTYTIPVDSSHFCYSRGAMVEVSHDTPDWGVGIGKVVSVSNTTFTMTNVIEFEAGKNYVVRVRTNLNQLFTLPVTPTSLETNTFVVASGHGIEPGDVITIGEANNTTHRLLITGIADVSLEGGTITAVDFSPEVAAYWANPPAYIASELSGNLYKDAPLPPNIVVVVSDPKNDVPDDAGITEPEVHVSVKKDSYFHEPREFQDFRMMQ